MMNARPPDSAERLSLEPVESLDAIRADWVRLAWAGESIFSTWEWASTWWRHAGRGRELHRARKLVDHRNGG